MAPSAEDARSDHGLHTYHPEKHEFDQTEHNQRYFPNMVHNLRACLGCRLIMSKDQFFQLGCPTCDHLNMKENEGRVVACTTTAFQGYIANIRPGAFVSRFNGLENNRPGVYALSVQGTVPEHIEREEQEEETGIFDDRSPEREPQGRDERLRRGKEEAVGKSGLDVEEEEEQEAQLPPGLAAALETEDDASTVDDTTPEGARAPARKRLRRADGDAAVPAPAMEPSESDAEFPKATELDKPVLEPSAPTMQPSESDAEFPTKSKPVLDPSESDAEFGAQKAVPERTANDDDEADEFVFKD